MDALHAKCASGNNEHAHHSFIPETITDDGSPPKVIYGKEDSRLNIHDLAAFNRFFAKTVTQQAQGVACLMMSEKLTEVAGPPRS